MAMANQLTKLSIYSSMNMKTLITIREKGNYMFQSRFILGTLSILLLAACILFVVQPTSIAHAEANIHVQDENDGIAIFGTVNLKNGRPVPGVAMLVGVYRDKGHWEHFYKMNQSITDGNGR